MVRIASDAIYLSLTSLGLASFWLFDKGIVAAVDTAGTVVDTGVTALRSSRIPIILSVSDFAILQPFQRSFKCFILNIRETDSKIFFPHQN